MTGTDAVQGERVAGRGLDAEVAERVMGEPMPVYTSGDAVLARQLAGDVTRSELGCWTEVCRYDEGDVPRWIPRPFSTDIAAAWEVVEHMEARWWWFALETFPNPHGINDGATVTARFKATAMPGQHDGVGKAEDAPLAICRAALKALDAASTS
jgi:hypothetical protein